MFIIPTDTFDDEVHIMVDSSSKKKTAFFKLSQLNGNKGPPQLSERENPSFERPFNKTLDD
jgi:hypothetical protein